MVGGTGNDTYIIDNANDQVVELVGADTDIDIDTILTSVDYSLKNTHVENITATGHEAINLTGNADDNVMIGNDANNTLKGNKGDDTLDGGLGADTLKGGKGDDIYYVDNIGDTVTEHWWSGHDTVNTTVDFDLRIGSIEDATALGSVDIALKGNWSDNTLIGNSGDNLLAGRLGDDTLIGGLGQDTLEGGWGHDTFVFNDINDSTLCAADIISDFKSGKDKIDLTGIDANTDTAEDDAFDKLLTGQQQFSQAGELKLVDGILYGNVNNDAGADFAIDLNHHKVVMTDFVL